MKIQAIRRNCANITRTHVRAHPRTQSHKQTNTQTNKQTCRQTERKRERERESEGEREREREKDTHTHTHTENREHEQRICCYPPTRPQKPAALTRQLAPKGRHFAKNSDIYCMGSAMAPGLELLPTLHGNMRQSPGASTTYPVHPPTLSQTRPA